MLRRQWSRDSPVVCGESADDFAILLSQVGLMAEKNRKPDEHSKRRNGK